MRKPLISYKRKLLLYFTLLFMLFAAILVVFQHQREEHYKVTLLQTELRSYTDMLAHFECLKNKDIENDIAEPIFEALPRDLRITILNRKGEVQYESGAVDLIEMENHLTRPEVIEALNTQEGHLVRTSSTTGRDFFYFAKAYPDCIIRVAVPYDTVVQNMLKADNVFLWFVLGIFPIVLVLLIQVSDHFGKSVAMLHRFIASAERGLVAYNHIDFPDSELGRIGQTIMEKYKQLEESHKAVLAEREKRRIYKRDMSNNITHELRTPVSSISGYLETLLTCDNLKPERQRYFLERAHAQTQRLAAIIRDISMITKVEEAPDTMPRSAIDVAQVVADVNEELSSQIAAKAATVHCSIPQDVHIQGNYSLVHAIFRNLIENALRYGGEAVDMYVLLEREDESHYHFLFYDTGKGIAPHHLPRIFERFFRADEGRTREVSDQGGTGLGLSIVRNAVRFHHGEIVASNREGAGLQFAFSLAK